MRTIGSWGTTRRTACLALAAAAAAAIAPAHAPAHRLGHAGVDTGGSPPPAAGSAGTVFARPLSAPSTGFAPTAHATILSVSDFHGRLNPTTFRIDVPGQRFSGAAYLQSYFRQRAALSPTRPFLVTQGDAVGATQPVSGLLGDRPTIAVMNRMGFDADTLGNHNFDEGVAHMRGLARRARFPYVVTNLVRRGGRRIRWTRPWTIWRVAGVRIGVIGAINEDAAELLEPGELGNLRIRRAAPALNAAAARLRDRGVRTVVALAHFGADPTAVGPSGATGPLLELARGLRGVDVLIGDHTYWQVNQPAVGADGQPVWVVQSVPHGVTFTELRLAISQVDGELLAVTASQFPSTTRAVQPDAEIAALVERYNRKVAPLVAAAVGSSTRSIPENVGVGEANQGNVATDGFRAHARTRIALVNSGGLRAPLTDDSHRDRAGNYVIRRGDVLAMLPFNDQLVRVTVTGRELKTMLENGVSQMPTPAARFPQVSGFSFTYAPLRPPQARVLSATLDDGTPISFAEAERYTLATSGFLATGGDGYPDYSGRLTYVGDLEDALIAYLRKNPTLVPPGPPHEEPRRILVR